MPIRKVGRLIPMSETAWNRPASQESRRSAQKTPINTPTTRAKTVAQKASSRVAGMRSARSCETGWRNWYEIPSRPCTTSPA
jgi:hypothetical protein